MIRPNAILINRKDQDGKRWNVVYIRGEDGSYTHIGQEYVHTTDPLNLDPFVNWLWPIPGHGEWVHPVHATPDSKGGWYLKGYDTYHEARWENKPKTLDELYHGGILFKCFDKLLDSYKMMSDEELEEELNIGLL